MRFNRVVAASTTESQMEHFGVELFCGITPLRARPTRETLRGIYRGPGERRGARRPARTFEELLQGIVAAWGTQEHRTHGGPPGTGCQTYAADAPIFASFGGQSAMER